MDDRLMARALSGQSGPRRIAGAMSDRLNGVRVKKSLTLSQVMGILNSLNSISNGNVRTSPEGRQTTEPFKMKGRTRMALAQNIAELKPRAAIYQEELSKKQRELGMSEDNQKLPPNLEKELTDFHRDLLDSSDDHDLIPILESELALDENQISPMVLSNILCIVELDSSTMLEELKGLFSGHVAADVKERVMAKFDEIVGVPCGAAAEAQKS